MLFKDFLILAVLLLLLYTSAVCEHSLCLLVHRGCRTHLYMMALANSWQ